MEAAGVTGASWARLLAWLGEKEGCDADMAREHGMCERHCGEVRQLGEGMLWDSEAQSRARCRL